MPTPPVTQPAARLDVRTLKFRAKRSFEMVPKRSTRARACYIELPRKLWDRIVLLMFTCCLFTFLHAFLGFGAVEEDLHASSETFTLPRTALSISSPWSQGSGASNRDQEMHARLTRVMVDWYGNYEVLQSTTSALVSPASIPQDAFPDPTPVLVGVGGRRALDDGSLFTPTEIKRPVDVPFTFDGTPYDPFRLEFEDFVNGGEIPGLYAIAGLPRTAPQDTRTRRFGRCLPGEACL